MDRANMSGVRQAIPPASKFLNSPLSKEKIMKKGFTLIELMIVVAIIGILAAIALPAYQDYVARTQVSEAMTLASGQKTAVTETWANTGNLPANNSEAGVAPSTDIKGKYVSSVAIATGGVITATMKTSGVAKPVQGGALVLTPTVPTASNATDGGSVVWSCSSGLQPRYLPAACRQ